MGECTRNSGCIGPPEIGGVLTPRISRTPIMCLGGPGRQKRGRLVRRQTPRGIAIAALARVGIVRVGIQTCKFVVRMRTYSSSAV
jgi:hypothetical protein